MDNDNKISNMNLPVQLIKDEEIRNDINLFLPEEMRPAHAEPPKTYDIETEYAKTKKNKSHYILFLMLATIFVGVLLTFCVSKYVEHQNEKIAVNIDVFDDLNLRNLLDVASQTQASYDAAVKAKSELDASLKYELNQAEQKRNADLHTLKSMNLDSKAEINKRSSAIEIEYKNKVEEIHQNYDLKISAQESLIDQYKSQLAEYDNAKIEQAQIIDSTKQLYEIEKAQMNEAHQRELEALRAQVEVEQSAAMSRQMDAVTEVTDKYIKEIDGLDPVITGKDSILKNAENLEGSTEYDPLTIAQNLSSQASSDYIKSLEAAYEGYENFAEAKKVVSSIPQKHSIPSFVNAMSKYAYNIGTVLTKASVAEVNRFSIIVDNCRGTIADLHGQLGECRNEIDNLNIQISSLYGEIDGYKGNISELETTIEDYKGNIVELESKIEDVKQETENVKKTYEAKLEDTIRTMNGIKDEKTSVEKDRSFLNSYLEDICIENKRDGLLLELPSGGKAQIYLINADRDYFKNPMYKGMVVSGFVKRGKNSKVTACTIIEKDGKYYCDIPDAKAIEKIKRDDWIGVASVALPGAKK